MNLRVPSNAGRFLVQPGFKTLQHRLASGHMVLSREPRKKSPVTLPGIDPGTSRLLARCLNHYAAPCPIYIYIYIIISLTGWPGSVVGMATTYGWTVRGSNPGGARFFAQPASCTMGTGSFPGVRCCRGVTLTPHLLLVPRSKIE